MLSYGVSAPDRLTEFNGTTINYDNIGRPVSYGDKTLSWEKGNLVEFNSNSSTLGKITNSYSYNAFGQRAKKEYTYLPPKNQMSNFHTRSRCSDYYYDHGGRLVAECWEENFSDFTSIVSRLEFLYDESGIIGFKYIKNGVDKGAYYYQRNLQGDVVCIYNTSGVVQVEYAYDAWGNCTIISNANSDIANINPIRYRGYYYDKETNLYYLNSRYYSPEWRRFISPDDTAYLDPQNVNGLNLYCYCNNDPVNYYDPSGHFMISTAVAVGFWIGLAVGGIAGATAGGIIAHNIAEDHGAEGWELFAWTMLGIVGGGAIGGAIGAALGSSIGYGVGLLWGTAPAAGSQGAVALWSGNVAKKVAADFAAQTGAKFLGNTLAGKTLEFASAFMPKSLSGYLWAKLSVEFVTGASSATIFLLESGIEIDSIFFRYEIWVLLEKGIERVINFV